VAAQSAQELDPKGKAAGEVAELYNWLISKFDNQTTAKPKKGAA
jgi:hypothetical protein